METKILIFGDFVGCGDVALATSRAILTRLGCTVLSLPTALISNTWNMGPPAVLDTTDYLENALSAWDTLGITPDAVLIGYLSGQTQAEFVARRCSQWRSRGAKIFLDPIFADNGKLYRGVDAERLAWLRSLLPQVDYLLPNATEACFLARTQTPGEALEALQTMGANGVLITGTAENTVLLWDGREAQSLPYTPVPGNYGGAGDVFTALFVGHLLQGSSPTQSARQAIDTTRAWILQNTPRPITGFPVERFFN